MTTCHDCGQAIGPMGAYVSAVPPEPYDEAASGLRGSLMAAPYWVCGLHKGGGSAVWRRVQLLLIPPSRSTTREVRAALVAVADAAELRALHREEPIPTRVRAR